MTFDELLDDVRDKFRKLVTLEIITAVGEIKGGKKDEADVDWDKDPKVMLTKIRLLQGDIKTVFDPVFVTGEYQDLREFHSAREKEGYDMIQKNIGALRELYNLAERWLEKPEPARAPVPEAGAEDEPGEDGEHASG